MLQHKTVKVCNEIQEYPTLAFKINLILFQVITGTIQMA